MQLNKFFNHARTVRTYKDPTGREVLLRGYASAHRVLSDSPVVVEGILIDLEAGYSSEGYEEFCPRDILPDLSAGGRKFIDVRDYRDGVYGALAYAMEEIERFMRALHQVGDDRCRSNGLDVDNG